MSRIVFLNRFYWPEEPATGQLLTDLAEELACRGYDVQVLTSGPRGATVSERRHGVAIHRVRSPRFAQTGFLGQAANWFAFGLGALWCLMLQLRRGDTLVLLTDPPLLLLFAGPIARLRGVRLYHWVQDVYPELPERLNGLRGLGAVRWLRNREWRLADGCAVLGADMARLLVANGVDRNRATIIPNWAPHGLEPAAPGVIAALREQWGVRDKFVVAYSGNMGRVHDLEPVLELAAALRDEPGCVFLFIGAGAQHRQLEAIAKAKQLPNVLFRPPQPRAQLATSLGVADVHLITLREQCEDLVFPSKLYGIAAVGRPVLFIGPPQCELAGLVAAAGMGLGFARNEIAGMARALRQWQDSPSELAALARGALAFSRTTPGLAQAANYWQSLVSSAH
jgi:glycosyltransferase involved in cell wall biosynthesis